MASSAPRPARIHTARSKAVVCAADRGPAHWLAIDAYQALARGADDETVSRVAVDGWLARAFGDDRTAWRCRTIEASALHSAGRYDECVAVAEELMAHYQAAAQPVSRLQVAGQLITARLARGEFERALDELTEALAELARLSCTIADATATTHRQAAATAFLAVASAASSAEMFEVAAAELRHATTVARQLDDGSVARLVDAVTARNETRWAVRLEIIGNREDAAVRYQEALLAAVRAQHDTPGDQVWRVGRLFEGHALTALGEPALGYSRLVDALGTDAVRLEHEDLLVLRLGLARACTELGRFGEARAHVRHTTGLHDTTFSRQWQTATAVQASEIERREGGDHPGMAMVLHACALLATALWEERERRLEAVMVRAQLLELAELNARAEHSALHDPLTGLGNRRKLDTTLQQIRAETVGRPCCMLFIDLDRFKAVNDTYSHAVGDDVLRAVAGILQRQSREGDLLVRYGGDEFVAVLRDASLAGAARLAERVRAEVAGYAWDDVAPGLAVRVSIGVAERQPGMSCRDVMAAADAAAYAAKQSGRDQVALA